MWSCTPGWGPLGSSTFHTSQRVGIALLDGFHFQAEDSWSTQTCVVSRLAVGCRSYKVVHLPVCRGPSNRGVWVLTRIRLGNFIESCIGQEKLAYALWDSLFLKAVSPTSRGNHFPQFVNHKGFLWMWAGPLYDLVGGVSNASQCRRVPSCWTLSALTIWSINLITLYESSSGVYGETRHLIQVLFMNLPLILN